MTKVTCHATTSSQLDYITTSYPHLEVELTQSTPGVDESGRRTGSRSIPCSLEILNLVQRGGNVRAE